MSEEKVSLSNQQAVQPNDPAFVPPASVIPLPSEGKVYPVGTALAGKSTLEIRAMTAKDEDILTSRGLLKSGRALDTLLKSCILDRNIDVDGMLAGDRNAVLVGIRITGYGPDYTVEMECPVCGEKDRTTFHLNKLPVKPLGAEPRAPNTNEFSFHLPVSNKVAVFKLLTGADERELSTVLERSRKAAGGGAESLITTRLMHQVVSIGGETDGTKLAAMIRNMPARDSRELRKKINDVSPGVDMRQTFTCKKCSESTEVDVPLGAEFFWPQS